MGHRADKIKHGRVTSVDVARAAGVSQSTVSRVFAPNSEITPRQKDHILRVANELGYYPNALARGLTMKRSNIVGIVTDGLQESFYSELFTAMVDSLQRQGMQLLVFDMVCESDLDGIISKLRQFQIDGMVLTAAGMTEEGVRKCSEMQKPIVMINRFVLAPSVKAVCCDGVGGGRRMVDFLVARGYGRFAVVAGQSGSYTSRDRAKGFEDRLAELGIQLQAKAIAPELSHVAGRTAMNEILSGGTLPEVVFCTNDVLALGAADAIKYDHGLQIPGDIALAGFDGNKESAWPSYNFTTIAQPTAQIVETAVATLNQMIDGEEVFPDCRSFEGELLVRDSTPARTG